MKIEFSSIPKEDPKTDFFIDNDILVDTYDEVEEMSAWYAYLENELPFPFKSMVFMERKRNTLIFNQVTLESMAPIQRCNYHQMWVMGRLFSPDKPLLHFFLTDIKSVEVMDAYMPIYYWKYWSQSK
jgi:hypothetical protein